MKSYESNIKQFEGRLQEEQSKTKDLETAYKFKKRAFDLLDDPDNNIAKLKNGIEENSKKMLELAAQWEKKRVPLIEAYRDLKDKNASRMVYFFFLFLLWLFIKNFFLIFEKKIL